MKRSEYWAISRTIEELYSSMECDVNAEMGTEVGDIVREAWDKAREVTKLFELPEKMVGRS